MVSMAAERNLLFWDFISMDVPQPLRLAIMPANLCSAHISTVHTLVPFSYRPFFLQ